MIKIGTRGSKLALAQAEWTADQLRRNNLDCELIIIKTRGDVVHDRFDKMEGKGFFTKEIEDALLSGHIDLAVHSLKDLPTTDTEGLKITAVPPREDAADVLISLKEVPLENGVPMVSGSRIGTSSNRRVRGLERHGIEAEFIPIRGNVPTRIAKMERGEADMLILARAGLNRLHIRRGDLFIYDFPPNVLVPAPGQGALGMQVRADYEHSFDFLNHGETRAVTDAERRILNALEGGCQLPLGVNIRRRGEGYHLHLFLGSMNKEVEPVYFELEGENPTALAQAAMTKLGLNH